MFKNRKVLIITAVAAVVIIAAGTYGGMAYASRQRAAFIRDFTQTVFGTVPLAYATDSTALTNDQINRILTLLRPLELEDTISIKRAREILAEIKGILTTEQQQAIKNTSGQNLFRQFRQGGQGGQGWPGGQGWQGGQRYPRSGAGGNGGSSGSSGSPGSGGFNPGAGGGLNRARQFRAGSRNFQLTGRMFTMVINALDEKLNGATSPNTGTPNSATPNSNP